MTARTQPTGRDKAHLPAGPDLLRVVEQVDAVIADLRDLLGMTGHQQIRIQQPGRVEPQADQRGE